MASYEYSQWKIPRTVLLTLLFVYATFVYTMQWMDRIILRETYTFHILMKIKNEFETKVKIDGFKRYYNKCADYGLCCRKCGNPRKKKTINIILVSLIIKFYDNYLSKNLTKNLKHFCYIWIFRNYIIYCISNFRKYLFLRMRKIIKKY